MKIVTYIYTFLFAFTLLPTYATASETPVVLMGYTTSSEAGLCLRGQCKDPNKMELQPLQGYWYDEPLMIIPRQISAAQRMSILTTPDAVTYDYSMQFYGNKQDVVSSFITKEHKKLWELLERSYLVNQRAARDQKDIYILGYAAAPDYPDFLFAFVTYTKVSTGEQMRRTFVFTMEGEKLKRTFTFASEHKEIYRVIETAFRNGGDDFKAYKYGQDGKIIGQLGAIYPQQK